MDRQTNGQTEKRKDGKINEWTDRQSYLFLAYDLVLINVYIVLNCVTFMLFKFVR
jgi:hypothetical protein